MTRYVRVPVEPSTNGERCADWCGFLSLITRPARCRLFGVPLKCVNALGDMQRAQACFDAEIDEVPK